MPGKKKQKARSPSRALKLAERKRAQKRARDYMERNRLFALQRGGAAQRPIEVSTPAVIEGKTKKMPCPICRGTLRVDEHSARDVDGESLRRVDTRCGKCSTPRKIWFKVVIATPN